MGDSRIPVSEVVEQLKLELAKLSAELRKTLDDSIYLRMSPTEYQAYKEKCKEFKRLTEELAQLMQLQHRPPAVISPPTASPELQTLNPPKPPKNEA